MEGLLLWMIFLLLIWAGVLSARLCCYQKQISHMLRELWMIEQEETNFLLTSSVEIGKTRELILAINRVLARSRSRLEKITAENRSYRESITCISHDIRTPLTSAKGYMQMFRNENVTEDKRLAYARIVERRLDDLAGLLDQLFLYARIEAGEVSLSKEELNAGNLFAETVSLFYGDFLEKNCEPEILIEQGPCYIQADRQAFVRIIENLIKNALVHGTGAYRLSLCRQKAWGQQEPLQQENVAIRIANTTESIEPGDIERIFDRFYTSDTSRSRKTTGLGLAIVKELTIRMGGEVKAGLKDGIFFVEVFFPVYAGKNTDSP